MLLQRVITAVVLLIVLLMVSVFLSPVSFRVFVALASAIALWEWLRITATGSFSRVIAGLYFVLAVWASIAGFHGAPASGSAAPWSSWIDILAAVLAGVGLLFWTILVPVTLKRADTGSSPVSALGSAMGVIVIGASALGLSMMHQQYGAWFIFSFLGVIWCADTFAYFGGRHFAGPRLAPAISPGKTRSGAACGLLAAVLWMAITMYIDGSFAAFLGQSLPLPVVLLIGAILAIYSMIGDLYESLLKRRAGIKDSSQLLPGHGGVWDRFDSILAVTPVVLALWLLIRHYH
ncbi:phosphatidate cytidylyltransferase [Advenella kashmirensis W13003]|uniref:Phosphatidate cytidylyltransferase n=1 Tax=Advenella kashmirensis W13003 TaxID=1424334 RepID=V8QRI6_9BURK|nr:phosphatidate cytidylyltransferase [Advenella kashmirensis]ETF01935.1 phosphatidate cytidylyltransferase [Advenella kashmirensis W13003]